MRVQPPTAVITDPAELAAIEPAWRALAAQIPDASYFVTPDWIMSWHETFSNGWRAEVAVWRGADGAVEGIVPLLHERHRVHRRLPIVVRCPTNLGSGLGAADHCGWVVSHVRRDDVRGWLADRARSGLLLRNLDATSSWSVPSDAIVVERTACPRLVIPADPEAASSTKFRKKLRWYARKVARAGISFRWVPAGAVTADLITTLLRLHSARANVIGRRTTFTEQRRDLHLRLAARGRPGCGPAAVVGERPDGTIVAVLYGFQWQTTFAYYQTGWDPALAELSLGTVLVAEAIKLAAADGVEIFDFLRGREDYKYRFGATDRHDETWLVPRSVGGRLLHARRRLVSHAP